MKISRAALPLLMPTWAGTAFQHHCHPILQHAPSSTHLATNVKHLIASRTFSSIEMSPILDQEHVKEAVDGEILSKDGCFAVVRVRDDSITKDTVAASDGEKEKEEDRVELAKALFTAQPQMVQNMNGGVIADGDLIGRTITFANDSQGLVVAYRHPIAFVLLDSLSSDNTSKATEACSISTDLFSIDPDVKSGSTVNYMAKHVTVNQDGTVSRASSSEMSSGSSRPIFVPIPKISEIGLINTPLVTGITAIDALTPIGKGQNMLIIGTQNEDSKNLALEMSNKRAWMINLLKSVVEKDEVERTKRGSKSSNLRCFYGLTAADASVRSRFMKRLENAGIQDSIVTVVSTQSNENTSDIMTKALEAAEAVAVAATACSLGEHHALTTGGDALIIVDDINLHKSLWDITTQQLVEIYGVDSVVKADLQGGSSSEMRGYFSGLVQRAAKFKSSKGGGSVTLILLSTLPRDDEENDGSDCQEEKEIVFDPSEFESMSEKIQTRIATLVKAKVPLTAANLRKIQIPVPRPSESEDIKRLALQHVEDLISMSDGQIWFDDELAKMGRSPPLDPSRSITRVGIGADTPCRADAPALRTVSGSLRFQFQQATDMVTRKDSSVACESGDAKQLRRQEAFLLAMYQTPEQTRTLSQECVTLIAASRGYFDKLLEEGQMYKAGSAKGQETVEGLIRYVEDKAKDVVADIDESLEMSLEDLVVIENAIKAYFAQTGLE